LWLGLIALPPRVAAQGCVAVRGCGLPLNTGLNGELMALEGDWVVSVSGRYLHPTRHFVGDVQQYNRQEDANQVINHQVFVDLGVQYTVTSQWNIGLVMPFAISDRSQLAPASQGGFRCHTQAAGLSDMRGGGYYWIWNPRNNPKGNVEVGMALKMPTGEDGAVDTFLTKSGPVVHPVDQSIQPGDGGWGFTVELNAYRQLFNRTAAYLQAFYLFNPENENNVLTWRDNSSTIPGAVTVTPNQASYYEHYMSIPDQYFARAGFSYLAVPSWGLAVNLGGRVEGIPLHDALGGSDGFRRPAR
jgi:hypothetical protein